MDKQALDEFFAKAEDILTDWNPVVSRETPDVMHGSAPEPGTEHEPAPAGASYYEQPHQPRSEEQNQDAVGLACPFCGSTDCSTVQLIAELADELTTVVFGALVPPTASEVAAAMDLTPLIEVPRPPGTSIIFFPAVDPSRIPAENSEPAPTEEGS